MKKIILQIALDFVDEKRALQLAEEAVEGGADWLEAGTPLIKSCGMEVVRKLRKKFPRHTIVADMKTMDTGRLEVEMAAKSGAGVVSVLGVAPVSTLKETVSAAHNYGARIMVDLLGVKEYAAKAGELERLGADYIVVHTSVDEQMEGNISFRKLEEIRRAVSLPLACAGGINSENAYLAARAGADIIVVGGAVTKADDAVRATREIKKAINKKIPVRAGLYRRVRAAGEIREIFLKVSAANISDALHRGKPLENFLPVYSAKKILGKVFTVRTYPGDWAKPVEAIDAAEKGDVIVIDAGGTGPAVWGELATHSACVKGIAGVVIWGGIRDVEDIRKLNFPAWARLITPQAGEPKGMGEMNVPLQIGGVLVRPGDWIVGDDDGLMLVSKEQAAETANRAMDVLEKENRIRSEIMKKKKSLAEVTELLKWEKK